MNVTTHAIWLQQFLIDLGVHFHRLIVIWCDNQIDIKLCKYPFHRQ
jgi:hypothetical protein